MYLCINIKQYIMGKTKLPEVVKPQEFGLEPKKATELTKGLILPLKERELLIQEFDRVSKLEISEENIPEFRNLRLSIQRNRTQGLDKWRKTNKEFFLRGGQFIDATYKVEALVNTQMEEVLMNGEKHFEILREQRLKKLQEERVAQITHYIEDADERDYTKFEDDEFDALLSMKKNQYEDRIKAEKKAEADRIAKEKADAEEREKQRVENIRLKAEADKKEKALQKERAENKAKQDAIEAKAKKEREEAEAKAKAKQDAIDAKIAKEREEERLKAKAVQDKIIEEARIEREKELAKRAKLEAELKAKRKAELDAEVERLKKVEKEKKEAELLAKAPVKERLTLWVNSFELPPTTDFNNETAQDITAKFKAFKKWALTQIETI